MSQPVTRSTKEVEIGIRLRNNKILQVQARTAPKMTNNLLMARITEREVPEIISSNYFSKELKWEKPLLLLGAEYYSDLVKESY